MNILKRLSKKARAQRERVKRIEKQLGIVLDILDPTGFYTSGERQVSARLDRIRVDHRGRYEFAAKMLQPNDRILDMACGIGYGSFLLARQQPNATILGVDLSEEAITFANRYYKLENNDFVCGNGLSLELPVEQFDAAISFETIEHVTADESFMKRFFQLIKPGGWFLCSVPNEVVTPHSVNKNPFHIRHYTLEDITSMLKSVGFNIEQVFSQHDQYSETVSDNVNGAFLLVKCQKPC